MGKLGVILLVTVSLATLGSQERRRSRYNVRQVQPIPQNNSCTIPGALIRGQCVSVVDCDPQSLGNNGDEEESVEFEECPFTSKEGERFLGICCPTQAPAQNNPVFNDPPQDGRLRPGSKGSNGGRYPVTVIHVDWPYSAYIPAVVHTVSSGSKTQFMFPFNPWSPELFPGFLPSPLPIPPPVGPPKPEEVDNGDGEFQDDDHDGISPKFPSVEPEDEVRPQNGSIHVPTGPWIPGVNWPPPIPTHPPDHTVPPLPTHPPGLFPPQHPDPHPTPAPPPAASQPQPHPHPHPQPHPQPKPQPANPSPGFPGFPFPPGWPWVTLPTPPTSRPKPAPRPTPPPFAPRPTQPPAPSPHQPSCGAPRPIGLGFKIVGGKEAYKNAWRWMAGLLMNGRFFCGGSLIDNYHVLTAAHCLVGVSPHSLSIRLGDHDFRTETESKHVTVGASGITIHPAYNRQNNQNDLAIIRLSSKVSYSNVIQPICLDSSSEDYANQQVTVAGWGSLSWKQPTSPVLYEITMRAWTNTECENSFRQFFNRPGSIVSSMLCAGTLGKDSCTGDSGGPLMVNKNGQWVQVGIVSWGIQCGSTQQPGVYTRVNAFRAWIDQNRT